MLSLGVGNATNSRVVISNHTATKKWALKEQALTGTECFERSETEHTKRYSVVYRLGSKL